MRVVFYFRFFLAYFLFIGKASIEARDYLVVFVLYTFIILWQLMQKREHHRQGYRCGKEIRKRLRDLYSSYAEYLRKDQAERYEEKSALQAGKNKRPKVFADTLE